jgi:hypothetical protein
MCQLCDCDQGSLQLWNLQSLCKVCFHEIRKSEEIRDSLTLRPWQFLYFFTQNNTDAFQKCGENCIVLPDAGLSQQGILVSRLVSEDENIHYVRLAKGDIIKMEENVKSVGMEDRTQSWSGRSSDVRACDPCCR